MSQRDYYGFDTLSLHAGAAPDRETGARATPRWRFFLLVLLGISGMYAQEITSPYHSKKMVVDRDSITIDSVSINTSFFKVLNSNQEPIDTSFYKIDYFIKTYYGFVLINTKRKNQL